MMPRRFPGPSWLSKIVARYDMLLEPRSWMPGPPQFVSVRPWMVTSLELRRVSPADDGARDPSSMICFRPSMSSLLAVIVGKALSGAMVVGPSMLKSISHGSAPWHAAFASVMASLSEPGPDGLLFVTGNKFG